MREWELRHGHAKKRAEFGPPVSMLPTHLQQTVRCIGEVRPHRIVVRSVSGNVPILVLMRHLVTIGDLAIDRGTCALRMRH